MKIRRSGTNHANPPSAKPLKGGPSHRLTASTAEADIGVQPTRAPPAPHAALTPAAATRANTPSTTVAAKGACFAARRLVGSGNKCERAGLPTRKNSGTFRTDIAPAIANTK